MTDPRPAPKPPAGLGRAGKALWRQIAAEVGGDWEFDRRELAVLALACRQRDELARVERALEGAKVVAAGSKGQPVVSQLVSEARQQRLAIAKLLGELGLPVEDGTATAATARARRAARARWSDEGRRRR